jgi:two-component system, cell cycle sensor histidine kinase and response regulator CckA
VIGFVMQIKKHASEPEKVLKYSQTIEKSATRGAELSSQLLSFARKAKREGGSVDAGQVVEEVFSICTETFPASVTVEKQVDPALYPIVGDHGELYQVLLNLCVNARDAVVAKGTESRGVLTIGAYNRTVGDGVSAQMLTTQADELVELRVSDNGTGIPEAIRERIFDPFFTTKERGRGTGLGLSVVYNIVRNHRGTILVDSEEGVGTTFRIYFPAVRAATTPTPGAEQRVAPARGKEETILIVDDEESMQELGRELLEEHGYKVLIASNGPEAIEIYRTQSRVIKVVILDLVMPGMDGGQTFLELKKISPDIKAFFCTGYMPDAVISALLEEEHLRAIQKPFNPDQFVQLVRDVLDGTS